MACQERRRGCNPLEDLHTAQAMDGTDGARWHEWALRGAVVQRCRRAWLHDLRGGLQTLTSGFELLRRAAGDPATDAATMEKASQLCRRALSAQEGIMEQTLRSIAGAGAQAEAVLLEELAGEAVRFLQNDAIVHGARLSLEPGSSASVHTQRDELRLLVLSLLVQAIDHAPVQSTISLRVEAVPQAALRICMPRWPAQGELHELIPLAASSLLAAGGGRLSIDTGSARDGAAEARLTWP